jgi:hypothetical protein
MAVIGLTAPAAFAGPNLSPVNGNHIGATFGPFHFITNVNQSVGINYPGTGSQVIVTTSPGNSYIESVDGGNVYVIHNSNGNCLRMRNGNNGFAVIEESGCTTSDNNERFTWLQNINNPQLYAFQNIATGRYLGVPCSAGNGSKVLGVTGAAGTCFSGSSKLTGVLLLRDHYL